MYRFQYVTLHLQGPLRRARSSTQRRDALKNLPRGLNETYERALLSIRAEDRTQTIRALKWLLASLETLTVAELAEASRIDLDTDPILEEGTQLDTEMSVWDMLPPGLVTLGVGREVSFAHSSFPEYLRSTTLRKSDSDAKAFFISQAAANEYVTECCMAYHIHASDTKPSDIDHLSRDSRFPLWRYAATHWMTHIENISREYWSPKQRDLVELILRNGSRAYLDNMVEISKAYKDSNENRSMVGSEALFLVAYCGHSQLLDLLLQQKDNRINVVNPGGTALDTACLNGHGEIVHNLLEHGADPWLGSKSFPCALKAAMISHSVGIIDQICKRVTEGDLFAKCCAVNFTPLALAIESGSEQLVTYFIDHGIPIDSQEGYFGTALQATAYKQNHGIFDLLLERGADIDTEGGQYGHALQAAASRGNEYLIKALLERGASINARSGVFGYALQAAALNGRTSVIKRLLDNGAEINAHGGKYGYALEAAAYMGHRLCAIALLKAGACINAEGGYYGNALQAAFVGGDRDMVNLLLSSGARVQPPRPQFEAVLARLWDKLGDSELYWDVNTFHSDHWYFNLNDPAQTVMQDPETGCWQVPSPAQGPDTWLEWWTNAPDNWRTPY